MKTYSTSVNLSEENMRDLQNGESINLRYISYEDGNVIVKINLFQGEDYNE